MTLELKTPAFAYGSEIPRRFTAAAPTCRRRCTGVASHPQHIHWRSSRMILMPQEERGRTG